MKLIKDLTKDDVIHCPTDEICRIVGKMISNKYGEKWSNYREEMCLVACDYDRNGMYSTIRHFKSISRYNIINGQDFINFNTKLNYSLW